ncbi:MAG: alpha/beta fold hydrolase [Nocardioidaceae bacterium]
MTFTTKDGLHLHVRTDGPDDAPVTVLLAHCWTADLELWRYQVRDLRAAFGDGVRVVRYDHRGHGRSDATPEQDATIDNLARDLSDLIDQLVPTGPIVLGGHSIGGMTIMALAARRPELFTERVVGVLFVSTSSGRLDRVTLGLPERVRDLIPPMLAMRSRMVGRRRRRSAPAIESTIVRRFLFGSPMRAADHRLAVDSLINTPAASMSGFFHDLMRHDRADALAVLRGTPVHVVVGEQDRLTPLSHHRRLVAQMPWARLTVAPGAGHMLPLERDRVVSDALLGLARQQVGVLAPGAEDADIAV